MAAICHQFVQNAWKKDLCSNCFKCKEEHHGGTACKPRYLATMYPSRAHSWRAPHSILKDTQQVRRPKGSAVHFPAEESQVIGFGGGECYSSDGEDTADQEESTTGSDGEEGEEERALQKLTRTNTDFNSNLSHSGLKLGKPVTDSEGKRKTLLVSVTPFEKKSYNLPNQNSKDVILKSVMKHNDSENTAVLWRNSEENIESLKQNDADVPSDVISNKSIVENCKNTTSKSFKENIDSSSPPNSVSNVNESEYFNDIFQKSLRENENNLTDSILNRRDEEKCKDILSKTTNDINANSPSSVLNQGITEKCKDSPIKSLKKHELNMHFSSVSNRNSAEKFKDVHCKSLKKNECSSSLGSFTSRSIAEKCKDISLTSFNNQNESVSSSYSTFKAKSDGENCKPPTKPVIENESSFSSTLVSNRNNLEKCKNIPPSVLKQNETNISCGVNLSKNGKEKCRDSKQSECETVTRLTNKCGTESRIPVIKTRPKPAARKSYDLVKKNEVTLKKVSEIKQTCETSSSQQVRQVLETASTQEVRQVLETASTQEVRQALVSASPQKVQALESVPSQEVRQALESASSREGRQALEKNSQDEVSKKEVELCSKMEISTQESSEGNVNCKNKSDVNESKEIVALPDEISTKECEHMFSMEESRELAGEPDGRADPDEPAEPPALPQSPPPVVDPRPSFLHGLVQVKPKIPAKPIAKLLQATPRRIVLPREEADILETESARTQKRQAPKPPPIPVDEPPSSPVPLITHIVQDKVTREHVPSCDLVSEVSVPQCPEPVPRKILATPDSDKKKATTGKGRFSLRKFLRLGVSKEDKAGDQVVAEELPVPRPRLEIIHPSELNGSNVEVVGRSTDENDSSPGRLTKPPPPPRNQSLAIEGFNRPARPPPPKSAELLLHQQKQIKDETPAVIQSSDNLYANLGEVRSGLTPSKPQRTSSIRDCASEGPRRRSSDEPVYECVRYKRSASLPYCSSEAGSDIYSPYSLYSDDAGDSDSGHPWKTSKLRLRKGRSVVHRSLEDNYGAVIVANHEALAQVLEQVHVITAVSPALRALKIAPNLCWTDFNVQEDACVTVGRRAFHPAVWGSQPVTLIVTQDQSLQSRGCLCPLAEFSDLVPVRFLPSASRDSSSVVQACVGVLSRMQVDSISSYGINLQNRLPEEERHRDGSFMLLQLINALKNLQAEGVEETSLSSFALCREDRDLQPRLCVLRGSRDEVSLCRCALQALEELLPSSPLTMVLRDLLQQERAVSLSQVKSVLEFSLWGPADVTLGPDREMVLQRWLDLERATVLQGLVRSRVELTALEECHLLFLVRTSAKTMCEASFLLDTSNPETTSF